MNAEQYFYQSSIDFESKARSEKRTTAIQDILFILLILGSICYMIFTYTSVPSAVTPVQAAIGGNK